MASYNPPNPYVPNAFNPNQYITPSDNITTQYLDENYLRFPFAQGAENFVSINNQGQLNQGGQAEFSSASIPVNFLITPTITTPFSYPDTTHTSSLATIGYVNAASGSGSDLLPLNNLWTGVNNFDPTPDQTYGATMLPGLTITNNQLDPGSQTDNDIISYSPNATTGGLCLYSLGIYSNTTGGNLPPQLQLQPNNSKSVLQAVASNGLVQLNATGVNGAIELNSDIGVNIGSASGSISKINFQGSNPTLNFSNWGNLSATSSSSGIISSVDLSLPSQTTYDPLTTYGDVASTQQFVQQAIASQGGGDVTTGGTNDFTGRNTFSYNLNGGTISASGLTIARNVETGLNDLDLVSINSTSSSGLNIYCETASVSSTSTPKVQIYNDGTATLFNTPVQIAQGQTGTTYNYALLTTNNTTYVPSINFLYDSIQALVVNQNGYFLQNYTIVASVTPSITYQYSFGNNPAIYNTTQAANALVGFTLSTSGKASFSFSPQPLNNTYSNNCAYLQLNPPVWTNGGNPTSVAAFFNGSANVYLLGVWNAAAILGTTTFPFVNPGTINTHQTTFYAPVYEYNTGAQYSQNFSAQVCSFTDGYGVQNIALVVTALLPQTISNIMVVQIPPFQITF